MLPNKIERLRKKVFPEAVQARSFGADVKKFVSFEPNDKKAPDQFCSDVVFGEVTLEKEDGEVVKESVVIKFQPAKEVIQRSINCDALFYNEILFYSKLIPLFEKYDTDSVLSKNFCEFVYGKATNGQNPKEDVIIVKNINKKGFKLTDERLFIDEKHIKLALEKIAKYHALSLRCQSDDPAGFFSVVSQIKNTDKEIDEEIVPKNFLTLCTFRGIDRLKNDPNYQDKLRDIDRHCKEADAWLKKYKGSSGLLNVINHGDFSRNNMMFKYGNNGEPLDVIFFDFAMIKYCSPAIDTSHFLFLNTSSETKMLHWDDFLDTYYISLSKQLDGHPAKPSFEDVELEWRRKGEYGYYVCSMGLPFLTNFKSKEDWEEGFTGHDLMKSVGEAGGENVTEYLAEMVKHMLDRNYIFEH